MIARRLEDIRQHHPDIAPTVIVGSGAVGLFLAKCLLSRGHRNVVVVEAGREALDNFDAGSFEVSGRRHEGIRIGRSRSLGGTSNLWGGQLVEFSELDFALRPWVPLSGWPISLEDLRPYYARSFGMLGIDEAFREDAAVWKSVIGDVPVLGDRVEVFLTRWMNVPSLARQLRNEIDDSDDLQVLLGHVANGFRFDGGRATAVRVRMPGGTNQFLAASTVIVAAGTIETSRLMLASALEPECPWRDNRMVGRRFQDHLGGRIATIRPADRKKIDRIFATVHLKGHKFQPKVRLARSQIEGRRVLASLGMVCFESSIAEHLTFLKQFLKAAVHSRRIRGVREFIVHAASCARYLPPLMVAYIRDHRVTSPSDASIALVVQAEQGLTDDSRITIDPRHWDASGLPRVVLDWKLVGTELASIRELAVQCDHDFRAAGLGTVDIDPLLMDCDPRMLDRLRDTNHPAGGCIMSADPGSGVVDTSLRVFGTENVYVVGASTFPTSSDSNVTFTAMALACRLADHLSEAK